ncbi:hypothetical protein [Alteromonas gilva]|uniref:Photosynthesis system II assembly factor Ycf48/Hcf136-like domain-containing protein n=1 Tax=Alteromonas gilva TaxID=2987522 RepID=A0ABT5L303_9ALTE|nr:hypothetical protein [Alteromonas gilva]MDC8830781.1 hypothetical protein [Alteromonas gilva]
MKKLIISALLSWSLAGWYATAANRVAFDAEAVLPSTEQPVDVSFQAVTWRHDTLIASGMGGGIFASSDNGISWRQLPAPPDSDTLQFRDNQLLNNDRLVLMSAGEGVSSGVFISDDFGLSWRRVATGNSETTFYDCFYMLDEQQGWLYGDADEQGLFVLHTGDGALSWQRMALPLAAQPGEGGFASSGTCLNSLSAEPGVIIGTGNGANSRLIVNRQGQWRAIESPISGGEAGGIFSVQSTPDTIYVSGGSLKHAEHPAQMWRYAVSQQRWHALPQLPMKGAVYGSALLSTASGLSIWVSNPQGVWYLPAEANSWQQVSRSNIWSLACKDRVGCVGVGKNGTIERYLPKA